MKSMKRQLYLNNIRHLIGGLFCLLALMFANSCDVHEFPDAPKRVALQLHMTYDTDMTSWETTAEGYGSKILSKALQSSGEMRYVIRLYPRSATKGAATSSSDYQEFIFTRNVADGYNADFDIKALPGDYTIMVWSDLTETAGAVHRFYDVTDFANITLKGDHEGNNDYRDAFRGTYEGLSLVSTTKEALPVSATVKMQRPLAKFEMVTTDLGEFSNQQTALHAAQNDTTLNSKGNTRSIDLETYRVKFYYSGFMPDTYSMFSDKPVDSATGVVFNGRLSRWNDNEASLGFDYVFVNGNETTVKVQLGIYNKTGELIAMTSPITVPLRRSVHTIVRGRFLTSKVAGGVGIVTDFDGEYNIEVR